MARKVQAKQQDLGAALADLAAALADFAAGVGRLAEAIGQHRVAAAPARKSKVAVEAGEAEAEAAKAAPEEPARLPPVPAPPDVLGDLRAAVLAAAASPKAGPQRVREVLGEVGGASRVNEVPEDKREAVLAAIRALLAG